MDVLPPRRIRHTWFFMDLFFFFFCNFKPSEIIGLGGHVQQMEESGPEIIGDEGAENGPYWCIRSIQIWYVVLLASLAIRCPCGAIGGMVWIMEWVVAIG